MILSRKFDEAFLYASDAHRGQFRKETSIPYMAHLLGAAAIALDYGANEEEATAALLHDVAEDAGGRARLDDVRQRFGDIVASIVEGCTDTFETPKPDWRPRKEKYLAHIVEATPSVRLVSAADKLHNARTILRDFRRVGDALWVRFKGGKDGTLWYYRALSNAFMSVDRNELSEELDRVVSKIEDLAGSETSSIRK